MKMNAPRRIIDKPVKAKKPEEWFKEFPCPHCGKIIGISWSIYNYASQGKTAWADCTHCRGRITIQARVDVYPAKAPT